MVFEHPEHADKNPKEKENVVLKIVAEQNTEILEEMEQTRKETLGSINQLGDTLAKVVKDTKVENNEKFQTMVEAVMMLLKKVTKLEKVALKLSKKWQNL